MPLTCSVYPYSCFYTVAHQLMIHTFVTLHSSILKQLYFVMKQIFLEACTCHLLTPIVSERSDKFWARYKNWFTFIKKHVAEFENHFQAFAVSLAGD